MAARTVGPAFGYMLGSACLTIYADPNNLPAGMTDDSPNWFGAWWIGFIVIGNFGVNFTNVLCTKFLQECHFGSFF